MRTDNQKKWLKGVAAKGDELLVPPTTCVQCTFPYIRTKGIDQEVCLICQRSENNHNHENSGIFKTQTRKIIGFGLGMEVYEDIEEWGFD